MNGVFEISDQVSPTLSAVYGRIAPDRRRSLMAVLGRKGESVLRRHFADRERTTPNKHGWARRHFWAGIRTATAYVPSATTDSTAQVSIANPALRLKVNGGILRPKEAKNLALPMNEAAYIAGMPRAGRLGELNFIPKEGGGRLRGYLGRTEAGGKLVLYYRLLAFVTMPKDDDALPKRQVMVLGLEATARSFIARGDTTK